MRVEWITWDFLRFGQFGGEAFVFGSGLEFVLPGCPLEIWVCFESTIGF